MSSNWDGQRNFQGATGNAQASQSSQQPADARTAKYDALVGSDVEGVMREIKGGDLATTKDRRAEAASALLAPLPPGPVKDAFHQLLREASSRSSPSRARRCYKSLRRPRRGRKATPGCETIEPA